MSNKQPNTLGIALDYVKAHPGRYLFPLAPGKKGQPCIKDNLAKASNDHAVQKKWSENFPGCSWGCSAKKSGLVCVDIDMGAGKVGAQSVKDCRDIGNEFPPTEKQLTPSGGLHLIYTGTHHFSASKIGRHIDTPNYFCISGTVREDGKSYRMANNLAAVAVPKWIAAAIKPRKSAPRGPVGDPVPFETFKAMLAATPYTGGPAGLDDRHEYDGWLGFAMAAHEAAGGDTGDYLWAFIDWCLADPEAKGSWSGEQMERHWASFTADPPQGQAAISRGSWFKVLEHFGHGEFGAEAVADADSAEGEQAFRDDPPPPMTDAEKQLAETIRAARKPTGNLTPQERFAETVRKWAWVAGQGFVRRDLPGRFMENAAWGQYHAHLDLTLAPSEIVLKAMRLKLPIRKYADTIYWPGRTPDLRELPTVFNMWRDRGVKPIKGDAKFFLDHMAYLFPDSTERKYVLDFLAHLVQHPGRKIKFALVLHGEKRTGKSWVGNAMVRVLGSENVSQPTNNEIQRCFTKWASNVGLAIIPEIWFPGAKAQEILNALKSPLTDETIRIELKGIDAIDAPNFLNALAYTNEDGALQIDNDDARWLIVSSPAKRNTTEGYYEMLFGKLRDSAAMAAVKFYLKNEHVISLDMNAPAPQTQGRTDMANAAMPDAEHHLRDLIAAAAPPFDFDLVNVATVEEAIARYHDVSNQRGLVAKVLKSIGAQKQTRSHNIGAVTPTLWTLRNHKAWERRGPTKRTAALAAHVQGLRDHAATTEASDFDPAD